jgi:mannosidase alpha-like ER degradation enhancer 2
MKSFVIALSVATCAFAASCTQQQPAPPPSPKPAATEPAPATDTTPMSDEEAARHAQRVREAAQHAWNGYRQYAWGHDDLAPLSKGHHDWYAQSLLMTPVDALDTLVLLGLDKEAADARELIATKLRFDHDITVSHFEVTIRLLGGLLSGYQLTGDKRLLALADDLGTRMLPVFDTATGLPHPKINLHTGKASGFDSNPAEAGTLLLEYGTLARLTGKQAYYDKAKRALVAVFEHRDPDTGLVGEIIDIRTGKWTSTDTHVGARIDSYYEYLWKCWKLFDDKDCLRMWEASVPPMHKYLADEVEGALWYGHADMRTGKRTKPYYGALDAFFPGLLAYTGDIPRAARLQDSGFRMWNLHGIEPETLDYRAMRVVAPGYPLRPEIVESAWYLHRLDGDPRWRRQGAKMFDDFVRHTRTEAGFAALKDVTTKEKADSMESFVLAETFKYYWLLFSPKQAIDLDEVVLNTEAHPLRRVAPPQR